MQQASIRCLSIAEVAEIIMVFLYDNGRGKTAVARMARTSKVIHPIAVAVLWQRIVGIKPIMSVIPGYEWRKDSRNPSGVVWQQTATSDVMDIKPLIFYTSHIKTLVWHYHYGCGISKYSIAEFQKWLSLATSSDFTLLPRVRTIEFTEDAEYYGILYRFLRAPALEQLHINADASTIEPILRQLDRSRSPVRSLHLVSPSSGHYWPPPAYDGRALGPIVKLRLAQFTAHDELTLDAAISLSRIDTLRHLSVAVVIEPSQVLPPIHGSFFDALETLKLSVRRLGSVSLDFIKAISSSSLKRFTLAVEASSSSRLSEELVRQHAAAISEAPFRGTLRSVTMFLRYASTATRMDTITVKAVQPLLGCRQLLSLEVFSDTAVLDLAACRFIASSFSHLDEFAFSDNSPSDRHERGVGIWPLRAFEFARAAPLEGLLAITKACRSLRSLHLPVRIETSDELVFDETAVLATIERGMIAPRYERKDAELETLVDNYLAMLLPRWPRPSQVTSIIPRAR